MKMTRPLYAAVTALTVVATPALAADYQCEATLFDRTARLWLQNESDAHRAVKRRFKVISNLTATAKQTCFLFAQRTKQACTLFSDHPMMGT